MSDIQWCNVHTEFYEIRPINESNICVRQCVRGRRGRLMLLANRVPRNNKRLGWRKVNPPAELRHAALITFPSSSYSALTYPAVVFALP